MSRLRVTLLLLLGALVSASCGSDPTSPDTGPAENPTEEPPDPQHLLTDEELRTAPSPVAAPGNEAWTDWIIANSEPIRSLTSDSFADLEYLIPVIGDRRLVQLGESGHGVSEFNSLKVRLIKFLHQEMGFDVIAFESSIYECYRANEIADQLSARNLMQDCIFGVWHANEVLPLFSYIKETRETARPLTLAGFDTQISSIQGVLRRPDFLKDVVQRLDVEYAAEVYTTDSTFVAQYRTGQSSDFVRTHGSLYRSRYRDLVQFLDGNEVALAQAYVSTPEVPVIARQTALSMIQFIAQLRADLGSVTRTEARDSGMAENLTVLMERLYPGKKVIGWAHNFHIRHANSAVVVGVESPRAMGTWLYERFGDDLYTLGFYMGRGSAAWNNRVVYTVGPMQYNSLEAILFQPRIKYLFVDLLHRDLTHGSSWMFEQILAMSWGTIPNEMILRNQYNGLVFIDTVNPPDYVN
jgi:erythromycin esterase